MDSAAITLGLDIGATRVRAATVQGARILASISARWPEAREPDAEVGFIADKVSALIEQAGAGIRNAGVAMAALLDEEGQVINWPNRPWWRGLRFRDLLESKLRMPIVVEDDANAAALAERAYGAGRGHKNLLVMMAGTGIGGGLILDGRLFRGRNGWAGEIGHVTVMRDGPDCPCGKRGCLQVLASGRLIERLAKQRGLDSAADVVTAAESGEAWARDALADCGRWIGVGAAGAVNLLDLEAVIIGGGMTAFGAGWWTAIEEGLASSLINREHRLVALKRAALPDTAGMIGAALIAREGRCPAGEMRQNQ